MKNKILEFLRTSKIKFSTKNDMVLFFSGKFTKTPKEVSIVVEQMIARGDIYEKKRGEFVVAGSDTIKGKIIATTKSYSFLSPVDKTRPDFFITEKNMNGAMDGDLVLAKILEENEVNQECQVISILQNENRTVVGTLTYFNGKDAFVVPDNKKLKKEIFVPQKLTMKAKNGYRVVVRVNKSNPKNLSGEVIEILGESDDIGSLELGIIRNHKLYENFPQKVLEDAQNIPQKLKMSDYTERVDLRKEKIFTIDGADAKDLDDAVSIKKDGGKYILGVYIADVGNYVKYGSGLDNEAYTRGTSVYFPNMVLPMLPKELSNGICSLNEKEDRLALSCEMVIDEKGDVKEHKIFESVICSCHRLTYDEVYDVILGKEEATQKLADIKDEILLMNELSHILEQRRKNAGALDLDLPESYIEVDENYNVKFLKKRERNEAHKIIENFMVICNETIAKHFSSLNLPFVYRVHEKPVVEKIRNVALFLQGLGVSVPEVKDVSPQFVQEMLKLTEDKPYNEVASKVLLRSLQKARYLDENLGHFGLALEHYCHFTSPIRRYPDLCIHRIIKENLHSKISKQRKEELFDFVMDASFRSSESEKNADEAERDVDDLFKAVYAREHIGEEFDGIISGIQNYGFYVELENTVEGLVKIDDLPQDSYLYMEKSLKLKGNAHVYSMGDKVRVKIVNSNVFDRKIDFILAN